MKHEVKQAHTTMIVSTFLVASAADADVLWPLHVQPKGAA